MPTLATEQSSPAGRFHRRPAWLVIFLTLLLSLVSAGCVRLTDYENTQAIEGDPLVLIEPGKPAGQSIIVRRSGLDQITLWIRLPEGIENPSGSLRLDLFAAQGDQRVLASASHTVANGFPNGAVDFQFPAQNLDEGQSIYFQVSSSQTPMWIYGRAGETYPYGQADQGGEALQGDLAFRLMYTYTQIDALADISAWISQGWLLLPIVAVFFYPGIVLLHWFTGSRKLAWFDKLGQWVALSFAFWALLVVWFNWISLPLNIFSITVTLLGLVVLQLLAQNRYPSSWPDREEIAVTLMLGAILLGGLFVRGVMVRDLSAPAWVDSVHHALITRTIITSEGIPQDYAPHTDLAGNSYHSGYHSGLAVFTLLSNLDLPQAMLLHGQLLNAVIALAAFTLARLAGARPWAAIAAAAVTAFITPMPAYYVSWGRYTQLAGLLLLPAAAWFTTSMWLKDEESDTHHFDLRSFLLAGLTIAGLFLIHYRVVVYLAILLIVWVLIHSPVGWASFGRHLRRWGVSAILLAAFAVAISAPSSIPILSGYIFPRLSEWPAANGNWFGDLTWSFLTAGQGWLSLWLAGAGALLFLFRKPRSVLAMLAWVGLMFLAANLTALGLLGGAALNNTSVMISFFLPIAVLIAGLADVLLELISWLVLKPLRVTLYAVLLLSGVALSIQGSLTLAPLINPVTIFTRQADLDALAWLEENADPQDGVLINPAAWGYGLYVGADGGFWAAPLSGLRSFPPTLLNSLGPVDAMLIEREKARELSEVTGDADRLAAFMLQEDLQLVFLGQRGGPISSEVLIQSPNFSLIYHQEGVSIFALR